ncbi:MAG: P-loop NTPase [Prolixibacteraceae bacterium]|jgi:MinD superfamily P-loop ATPase|nr:P-loop NTPase [Prolixibacteraceae bacterium]
MNEICVLSGKGGTGKTSISAAFATLGGPVAVADCDVDAANLYLVLQPENKIEEKFIAGHKAVIDYDLCTACGLCIDYCRFGAISFRDGEVAILETSCDGCKLCSRICPVGAIEMIPEDKSRWYSGNFRNGVMVHARLAPGEENSGKLVNVVREQVRKVAEEKGMEPIIIDGPPGTGCPVISSVTGADKVVVVTEPTRSGFHDMKRILELVANFRIQACVVINKYDLNEEISVQVADWCAEMNIPVVGKVPFDKQVVEAMLHCKSIVEWAPESEASKEIKQIWKQLNSLSHD